MENGEVYIVKLDTFNPKMVEGVINDEARQGSRLIQILDRMGVLWLFFSKGEASTGRKLVGKVT